jgi:integrase
MDKQSSKPVKNRKSAGLTVKELEAKATGKKHYRGNGGGLYLEVSAAGSKRWKFRYSDAKGVYHWFDLGAYPDVPKEDAERASAEIRKKRRTEGFDPLEDQRQQAEAAEVERLRATNAALSAEAALAALPTVEKLFKLWQGVKLVSQKDGGKEVSAIWKRHILPRFGCKLIRDVTKRDVSDMVDGIVAQGHRRTAFLVLTLTRQFFRWAMGKDYCDVDPTAAIVKAEVHKPAERERALTDAEVQLLFAKLPAAGLPDHIATVVRALLATGARIGELCRTRRADVSLTDGTWRIPEANAKNKQAHTVYLSEFALTAFRSLDARAEKHGSEWLVASHHQGKHVTPAGAGRELGDRQRGCATPSDKRSAATCALVLAGGKWTAHDLRRTAATLMASLGVRPEVIERCLNHRPPKLMRTYQRYDYGHEMADAWRLLGQRLTLLADPQSNVVLLRPRAA